MVLSCQTCVKSNKFHHTQAVRCRTYEDILKLYPIFRLGNTTWRRIRIDCTSSNSGRSASSGSRPAQACSLPESSVRGVNIAASRPRNDDPKCGGDTTEDTMTGDLDLSRLDPCQLTQGMPASHDGYKPRSVAAGPLYHDHQITYNISKQQAL
jgi:hypothetical protein